MHKEEEEEEMVNMSFVQCALEEGWTMAGSKVVGKAWGFESRSRDRL